MLPSERESELQLQIEFAVRFLKTWPTQTKLRYKKCRAKLLQVQQKNSFLTN